MPNWSRILEKIDEYRWRLPKSYKPCMNTDGLIFADQQLMEIIDQEEAVEQVANVACLPGIVGNALAMPDIHWGYGFPVGGVAAFDARNGIISPGGIGYDINCGVRLLKTNLEKKDIDKKIELLTNTLLSRIPVGVGTGGHFPLDINKELAKVLEKGAQWAVSKGLGSKEDLEYTESNGTLEQADPDRVSTKARQRGKNQIGTLGAGNHFIEVQYVTGIYDEKAARAFGIEKNMITVMIHSGSRGLGHQTATDYLEIMNNQKHKFDFKLPDRQLVCAPINSDEGRQYLEAMSAAANYAWANRQVLAHLVRESFERVFNKSYSHLGLTQVYDVAHNIAKFETHTVNGKKALVCVHRKGATRSFGPGSSELPDRYREVGQPVIIPGDMGRCSFLMTGTNESAHLSFSSTCHGAGRVMSRNRAIASLKGRDISEELRKRGIIVKGASGKSLAEEAPEAYKDVSIVVNTAAGAGLAKKVAKMKPIGVIKG